MEELRRKHAEEKEKRHQVTQTINRRAVTAKPREQEIMHLKARKREQEDRRRVLNDQIGTPLTRQLTNEERTKLEQSEVRFLNSKYSSF